MKKIEHPTWSIEYDEYHLQIIFDYDDTYITGGYKNGIRNNPIIITCKNVTGEQITVWNQMFIQYVHEG